MAFRSDLDAAHARVKALEAELARAAAENRRLRGEAGAGAHPVAPAAPTSTQAPARPDWPARLVVGLVTAAALGLGVMLALGAPLGLTLALVGAPALAALVLVLVLHQLVVVARPGELVVLSGRPRTLPDGSQVGFRLLREGRAVRFPLLEQAQHFDLRPLSVEVTLLSVYSRDRTPVSVRARAEVRFSPDELHLRHAVERLLGVPRADVTRLVRDTLESGVREVMSQLPASTLEQDAARVAETVIAVATPRLHAFGLEPATLTLTRRDDGVDSAP
ncbi:MAG: flotillin family protein [Deltaproteobacteria bacterium]|nr:flotillin family protein [Deltaproteobacteria bacterium]